MKNKYGVSLDSVKEWEKMAQAYSDKMKHPYHRHRMSVIRALIPAELRAKNKVIFDFGCGDAALLEEFVKKGALVSGCDPSKEMVKFSRVRMASWGQDPERIILGSVAAMKKIKAASCDAVMSFNVLAYLTDEEEREFYRQARRILKSGGHLIVTHSNDLFDLYSCNRYTVDFLKTRLITDEKCKRKVGSLFTHPDAPEAHPLYNVRENPLAYPHKLSALGFDMVQAEYINWHAAPPLLKRQETYPDTLRVKASEKWKLMFSCSTFGARAVKK